jgi:hypothetical protein
LILLALLSLISLSIVTKQLTNLYYQGALRAMRLHPHGAETITANLERQQQKEKAEETAAPEGFPPVLWSLLQSGVVRIFL